MTLIKDYLKITEANQKKYGEKTILYMQVGAFFEVYGLLNGNTKEVTGSKIKEFSKIGELNICQKKICVGKKNVLMAGFRDYQLEKYVKKLNDMGYTIVVYTQDMQAKNTTRSLQGVYSPGTYFNTDSRAMTNNIMCIKLQKKGATLLHKDPSIICGLASLDIMTGTSVIFEFEKKFFHYPTTYDEIERFASIYVPHELIIIYSEFTKEEVEDIIQFSNLAPKLIHYIPNEDAKYCEEQVYQTDLLKRFYSPNDWDFFYDTLQFSNYPFAVQAFCYLLNFVEGHNPALINNIEEPRVENMYNHLILANHSLKQLNIIGSGKTRTSSVLSFLNRCITPMGKRNFRHLLLNPTTDIEYLNRMYENTKYVWNNYSKFEFIRSDFNEFQDIEKLYRKIILNKVCPSELVHLHNSMKLLIQIEKELSKDSKMKSILHKFDKVKGAAQEIKKFLNTNLNLKKAIQINLLSFDINIFKRGIYETLDKIDHESKDSFDRMYCVQNWLSSLLEAKERKRSKTLVKIHTTEKSGYSLILTKRRSKILKDILAKYETIELKYNDKVMDFSPHKIYYTPSLASNVKIESNELNNIYRSISINKIKLKEEIERKYREFIFSFRKYQESLELIVEYVSFLDVLVTKAYTAKKFNYCCPKIDLGAKKSFLMAQDMRHCLIEHIQQNEVYVPNDVSLGLNPDGILLYGTNAVGKSSLIRSMGICVILAQAGMFVPCSEFVYKPYHQIFTRILGNDDIFKGLSTFAVEMSELRTILNNATEESLILGDELCSGTETISAISIFAAALKMLSSNRSSFIFATHFHEIADMKEIEEIDSLKMMHMEVKYDRANDILIYNRKIKDGPGESMYGLEVCKSLDLPSDFLNLAYRIRGSDSSFDRNKSIYNSKKLRGICELCQRNDGIDIHHLEYQIDANEDGFIGNIYKNHVGNLINICKECHNNIHKKDMHLRKVKTSKGMQLMPTVFLK
uniref:DNA mismatch repair protein (MutS) n=1 Tax=uncultured marine group II/III euryarchaeote AD1000_88_G11 TaxID=1457822 RepID=A0A075G081_9EURY|nr:DNA mismatch repair protein (mutS) [uncultured marine group II/III euryarchaeote AD1000_88_G11]